MFPWEYLQKKLFLSASCSLCMNYTESV